MHASTARVSEMCCSLGTSVADVCNKIEFTKRCAIFVVYFTDLEIFDCR